MIGRFVLLGVLGAAGTLVAEPVRSGKAEMEMIAAQTTVEAGAPVLLGFRMKMEPGWHTYWTNPGESGMKPRVRWTLPEGFVADEILYPFPDAFQAGDLRSYGYHGEVIFPVWVRWPETLKEVPKDLTFSVRVDWLTCDDAACVPGRADFTLILSVGDPKKGPEAAVLEAALERTPVPQKGWVLEVVQLDQDVHLTVKAPEGQNLSKATVYPVTELALASRRPLEFHRKDGIWLADTTLNEYAEGPLQKVELAISPEQGRPVLVTWSAEER